MSAQEPSLYQLLARSAEHWPDRIAVREATGACVSYRQLLELSAAVASQLHQLGVHGGERVAICLPKSIDAVAAIFGVLRLGAAYVPLDSEGPLPRAAGIAADCAVAALIADPRLVAAFTAALAECGHRCPLLPVAAAAGGGGVSAFAAGLQAEPPTPTAAADDLAYLLYTSGSTGRPKGVALTQRNALSFVDWCSTTLTPSPTDRFSSHAPFHFDLSILDLFVSLRHGAELVLFGEAIGKDPASLAAAISATGITVWYSVPSILALMTQYGRMETHDYSALRAVLFAGEVFPIPHLRRLRGLWPQPRYLNLYGPTETNVCTWLELPREIPPERTEPFPIGKPCSHARTRVVDAGGRDVAAGAEGELLVAGAGVMQGYWNRPELTAAAFADGEWYRTGDLVVEDAAGDYVFRGRRDRMVKRRGYRIELGEIEAGLYRHPGVREAAATAQINDGGDTVIAAHLVLADGHAPSPIAFKRFSSENLPGYMIPDRFTFHSVLPKTSTGKVDYQSLKTP